MSLGLPRRRQRKQEAQGQGGSRTAGSHLGCRGGSERWTRSDSLEVELGRALGQLCGLPEGLWLSGQVCGDPGGFGAEEWVPVLFRKARRAAGRLIRRLSQDYKIQGTQSVLGQGDGWWTATVRLCIYFGRENKQNFLKDWI